MREIIFNILFIIIVLCFYSCNNNKFNSSYFVKAYDIDNLQDSKYNSQISIKTEFMKPFYFHTTFYYKENSKYFNSINTTVDSIRFGEQLFFYENSDNLARYKFYNTNNTHSYALYFDENGELLISEGDCNVYHIPTRDSIRLYEIDFLFSIFYYDSLRIYLKRDINSSYVYMHLEKVNYSPFLYSLNLNFRNEIINKGILYFKYELMRENKLFYQFDTFHYEKNNIW